MRRLALAVIGAGLLLAPLAHAQEESETPLPRPGWSFDGPFGTYDRGALQRGFQVYQNVCANCHSLNLVTYDDLGPNGPGGGIGYSEDQVKGIAAQKESRTAPTIRARCSSARRGPPIISCRLSRTIKPIARRI